MIKSNNPTLKPFEQPQRWDDLRGGTGGKAKAEPGVMTLGGTIQASAIQMGCALGGAMLAWIGMNQGWIPTGVAYTSLMGMFGVLFIGGMFLWKVPKAAIVVGPILSFIYGAFAGIISFIVAMMVGAQMAQNPALVGAGDGATEAQLVAQGAGIILNAILLTMGVVGALLALFTWGKFRLSTNAKKIVAMLTMAVMFTYVAGWILRMFGIGIPLIHEAGPIGIAFSGFVVILASFNVLMAFQSIEEGVQNRFPKHFEWYAGYALVSTIIWLYIEILYLLYKLYLMFGRE